MNCILCGQRIKSTAFEGADYIKNGSDYWCIKCVRQVLARWPDFERYERLAEEGSRYREGLISTLQWSINEGYCVRPKERCKADAEKCLRCWLLYLVGEE